MRIFGGLISPYVRKICLVLEEKGLPYELTQVSPHADHPEFRAASPFGKIPALVDGDYRLADSSAIVGYVESLHPERPIVPVEARARGRTLWYDEFADTIFAASALKILFNRFVAPKLLKLPFDEETALEGEAELPRSLDYIESIAPESGWLLGHEFTLADIAVASVFRSLAYVGHAPAAELRPRTAAWYDRVCTRPAWQAIAEKEVYRPKRAQ